MKYTLTVKEYAELKGISHQAVYKQIKKGRLKSRRVQGKRMLKQEVADEV